MKRLHEILKIAFCCNIGVFAGMSFYQYYDFKTHPGLYTMQSAPWYYAVLLHGAAALVIAVALAVGMRLVKRKIK